MAQNPKKPKKGLHPTLIHAQLKMKGHTYVSIAKDLTITRTSVETVVKGKSKNLRVAKHVADLIEKPIDELWPGEYGYTPRCTYKERCKQVAA